MIKQKDTTKEYKKFYKHLQNKVIKFYGEKCEEYCFGCYTCKAHRILEDMKVLIDDIVILNEIKDKQKN